MVGQGTENGGPLAGRNVVVIGGSAGVGRAAGLAAARRGATVAFVARRKDVLDEAVTEAGGGHAICGDLADEEDIGRIADDVAATLGRVDMVLHCAAYGVLEQLAVMTPGAWERILTTNVLGCNLMISRLLPCLSPSAIVAVLSSDTVGRPRHGLGAYAASKAAVEESLRNWRSEHAPIRFACVRIGATFPTDFGANFEGEAVGRAALEWSKRGILQELSMRPEHVAAAIIDSLAATLPFPEVGIEDLVLRSPAPVAPPTTDLGEALTWAITVPPPDPEQDRALS